MQQWTIIQKYEGSDPILENKLLHSIYVNDIVFEAESIESAHLLYWNCKLSFLQGGLPLRKFVTNSVVSQEQIQNNEADN